MSDDEMEKLARFQLRIMFNNLLKHAETCVAESGSKYLHFGTTKDYEFHVFYERSRYYVAQAFLFPPNNLYFGRIESECTEDCIKNRLYWGDEDMKSSFEKMKKEISNAILGRVYD